MLLKFSVTWAEPYTIPKMRPWPENSWHITLDWSRPGLTSNWIPTNATYLRLSMQLGSGWWFGTWLLFFHSVGNVVIPTDELIFFKGVGIPPTRDGLMLTMNSPVLWMVPIQLESEALSRVSWMSWLKEISNDGKCHDRRGQCFRICAVGGSLTTHGLQHRSLLSSLVLLFLPVVSWIHWALGGTFNMLYVPYKVVPPPSYKWVIIPLSIDISPTKTIVKLDLCSWGTTL